MRELSLLIVVYAKYSRSSEKLYSSYNVVYQGKIIFLQIFVLAVVYYFDRVGIKINDYTKNIGNLNRYFQDKTLLIKTTKSVMSRSHFESKGLIPFAPYLVSISENSF